MAEYRLSCFGESGNAYKVALYLELAGLDWEPVPVDFFGGETRGEAFRADVNEMGEAPVLAHEGRLLTQSGAILTDLARRTGHFAPADEIEALRWLLFDNHKLTGNLAALRFLFGIKQVGETPVVAYLRGRAVAALEVLGRRVAGRPFVLGEAPTIADLSLAGYLWYPEPTGIDLRDHPAVLAWRDRIAALPRWRGPYDLMPRVPRGG